MHIKRGDLDEWIKKLYDRGIIEFEFRNLPDDLNFRRGIQKAKHLGLIKSVKIVNGRHTWKIMPCNISRMIYKQKENKKIKKEGINEFKTN